MSYLEASAEIFTFAGRLQRQSSYRFNDGVKLEDSGAAFR